MTTTAPNCSAATAVPQLALAGSFLEGLAAQDFARLGDALAILGPSQPSGMNDHLVLSKPRRHR